MKSIALAGLVMLSGFNALAQCGSDYIWPADKAKAEESLVLLKDNRSSNPKHAIDPLNWLIANAPNLNKSLYIYGADVYSALAKSETDAAKKAKYVDSLLIIHDLRIKNTECNEKAAILARKALATYPYLLNTDKVKDLLKMFDEAFQLNGNAIMDGTLVPYMNTVYVMKMKYKALTDDEVIDRYDIISDIIDQKIKKAVAGGQPADKYTGYQTEVNKIYDSMNIIVDCARVKEKLKPRYDANPNDIELAKKIFYNMLRGKCTDDPLWLETAEKVYKETPDFGIAKNLSIKYLAQDNMAKAEEWARKALSIAPTSNDKGEVLILLAKIEAKQGNKVGSRDYCRQAIATGTNTKEAYELIGDLYMNSVKECAREQSHAEDRLVFIAAFEMYAKAGEQKKMAQAKSQFPSNTELFEQNWKEGDTKKIDWCWVGETVTLRSRGKE
jgi:tetratricopeptide (TPR) repeat protein